MITLWQIVIINVLIQYKYIKSRHFLTSAKINEAAGVSLSVNTPNGQLSKEEFKYNTA